MLTIAFPRGLLNVSMSDMTMAVDREDEMTVRLPQDPLMFKIEIEPLALLCNSTQLACWRADVRHISL